MKTKFSKTLLMVVTCIALSCNKNDSSPSVSSDDAANAVGSYLSSDFASFTSDVASLSTTTSANAGGRIASSPCGVTFDTTLTQSGTLGAVLTYSYQFVYEYTLSCNGSLPSSFDINVSSSGTYNGVRLSSTGSGTGDWTVTGFGASSTNYILNGSFTKTETITQKTGAQKSFSSNLSLASTNVLIDKSTKTLGGGAIAFTMTGSITGGSSFSYSGTITFLGSEKATITVGSTTYTVDLSTGTVTKS